MKNNIPKQLMQIATTFRDVGFVFLITYYMGAILSALSFFDTPRILIPIGFLVTTISFCFVIYWRKEKALKYLLIVALLLFLSSGTLLVTPIKISIINGALTFSAAFIAFTLSKLRKN